MIGCDEFWVVRECECVGRGVSGGWVGGKRV